MIRAGLDDCGYLPVLARDGFSGPPPSPSCGFRTGGYCSAETWDALVTSCWCLRRRRPHGPGGRDAQFRPEIISHADVFEPPPDARNGVIFTGFEVPGTLGSALVDGAGQIKIHGHYVPVRAE